MITTIEERVMPEEIIVKGDVVKIFLANVPILIGGGTVRSNPITTKQFIIDDKQERDKHAELVGKAVKECIQFLMRGVDFQSKFDGVVKLERTYECEPCRELEKNGEDTFCHFNYELFFTPAQP